MAGHGRSVAWGLHYRSGSVHVFRGSRCAPPGDAHRRMPVRGTADVRRDSEVVFTQDRPGTLAHTALQGAADAVGPGPARDRTTVAYLEPAHYPSKRRALPALPHLSSPARSHDLEVALVGTPCPERRARGNGATVVRSFPLCRRALFRLHNAPHLFRERKRSAARRLASGRAARTTRSSQAQGAATSSPYWLVSRHRSSVGLRWPSKRIAALHRLPIRSVLAARCALRCAPMAARSLRHLIGD